MSDNMKARLLHIKFNANDTDEGLMSVQIVIPTKSGGHRAAKTVIDAFVSANIELMASQSTQEHQNLIGSRNHYF